MRAIVTGGGTAEPIDDVRFVSNVSEGKLSLEIARALARAGVNVVLLGSKFLAASINNGQGEPFEFRRFFSFADLERELNGAIEEAPVDFLFMGAAVSDYRPIRTEGKIRSDSDELIIRCVKNPKLLSGLRDRCGQKTFLVGFKLLSGVSHSELVTTALEQTKKNRLNLTVANDLSEIKNGQHPITLVTPEGGALERKGTKEDVARAMVEFAMKRQAVRWFRTEIVTAEATEALEVSSRTKVRAAGLLHFAHSASLLHDFNGNLSVKDPLSEAMIVSPRKVNKGAMGTEDLVIASVDLKERIVRASGKSSIDTGVSALLYRSSLAIGSLLHFHPGRALVLDASKTAYPFPCGTVEEGLEILRALDGKNALSKEGSFMVELINHGYLLGISRKDEESLLRQWEAVVRMHKTHLKRLDAAEESITRRTPLFVGAKIVGLIATVTLSAGDEASSLFMVATDRHSGHGSRFAALLRERGDKVITHPSCEVRDFYVGLGYEVCGNEGEAVVFRSPVGRSDIIASATLILINPRERTVLLGERLCDPWPGIFAFPGGRTEQGESRLSCVKREVLEETGIDLEFEPVVFTGEAIQEYASDGHRVFDIQSFIAQTFAEIVPRNSSELRARWVLFERAFELPLGPGTRRALRRVLAPYME